MSSTDLLSLFTQKIRIEIEYPDMEKEILPEVVRLTRPTPGYSRVLYSSLDESNADRVIQEQIDYFQGRGLPWEWKVYDYDRPADLKDRLVARGFQPDEEPGAVLVLDLRQPPAELVAPLESDVRQVMDPAGLDDVMRVEEQVWGKNFDLMRQRMTGWMQFPGYLSVYVAYVDRQPACTGWVFFYEDNPFGSLWGGSTVESYRDRGLYKAILAARVQEAIRRDYHYLYIEAGPMSQPIVEHYGFKFLTYATAYEAPEAAG